MSWQHLRSYQDGIALMMIMMIIIIMAAVHSMRWVAVGMFLLGTCGSCRAGSVPRPRLRQGGPGQGPGLGQGLGMGPVPANQARYRPVAPPDGRAWYNDEPVYQDAAGGPHHQAGTVKPKTVFLVPRTDKIQIAFTDGGREIQQSLHTDLLKLYKSVMEQLLERDQFIQTMNTLMDKTALLDNLAERVRRLELRMTGRSVELDVGRAANQNNFVTHGEGRGGAGGGGDGRRSSEDKLDNVAKKVRRQQEDLSRLQNEHQTFNKLLADQQLELQRHRDFTGKLQQNVDKMGLEISRNKQMTIAQAELLDHHANKMETQRSTSEVIDAKVATVGSKVQWQTFRLGMIENVTSRLDSDYISMQLSFGEFHTTQRKIYGLVEKLQTDTERCHVNVATAKMKVRFLEQDVDKLLIIVEKLTPATNVSYHAGGTPGGSSPPKQHAARGGLHYHNATQLAGSVRIQVQEMIDHSVSPLNQAVGHLNTSTSHLERENMRQQKQIDKASVDILALTEEAGSHLREVRAVGDKVDDVCADVEELGAEHDRLKRRTNKLERELREHGHPHLGASASTAAAATEPDPRARTTVGHLRRTTRSLDDVTPVAHGDTDGADVVTPPAGPTEALVTPSARSGSLTTETGIKVTMKPITENDANKDPHHGRRKPGPGPGPSGTVKPSKPRTTYSSSFGAVQARSVTEDASFGIPGEIPGEIGFCHTELVAGHPTVEETGCTMDETYARVSATTAHRPVCASTPVASTSTSLATDCSGRDPFLHPDCNITSFGRPQLVRLFPRIFTGVWMKDPVHPDDERIYVIRNNQRVNNIREYANETALSGNIVSTVHHMPHKCTGTGHVVYNGHVYCHRYQSNRIVKYNIATAETFSERLRNAAHSGTYAYSSGGNSDIDLAIDEDGLWAIYSTKADDGMITISKLDPDVLTATETWVTSFNKTEASNAFMMCGRLYVTIFRHGDPIQVAYIYDTHTSGEIQVKPGEIAFRNRNPDMQTSLDYNPADRRLYAWNLSGNWDGLLVVYDVHFEGQS